MNSKHTPGPWRIEADKVGRHITYSIIGEGLCAYFNRGVGHTEERAQANARLIAAAPDLLAACRLAHDCATRPGGDIKKRAAEVVAALENAIAKATGETQ